MKIRKYIGLLIVLILLIPNHLNAISNRSGVNDTISQNFSDPNMAIKVASVLNKNINDTLVQSDIDSLTSLDVSNSNIIDLAGVGIFSNLTTLKANNNQITQLPSDIISLTKLSNLTMSSNSLTSLPENINQLTKLRYLYLSDNQLTSLPNNITLLPLVSDLLVSDNKLTSLPEDIGNLNKMTRLHAYNNFIEKLPTSITNLVLLNRLHLANNKLVSLPSDLDRLNQLQNLYLSDNQLTSLPLSITNMNHLSTLNISNNLLPSNAKSILMTNLSTTTITATSQHSLDLISPTTINVTSKSNYTSIDYKTLIELSNNDVLSHLHEYQIENIVDLNNNAVLISDYYDGNNIIKTGSVKFKIRAIGTGLFLNNSDNAITFSSIQINFTAKTHNVKFISNYSANIINQIVTINDYATKPSIDPSKPHYEFMGWYDDTYLNEFDFTTPITKDMSIYAVFKPVSYQVIYYLDDLKQYYTIDNQYDSILAKPQVQQKEGYKFLGYSTSKSNTNYQLWNYEKNKMPGYDLKLYAKYEKLQPITKAGVSNLVILISLMLSISTIIIYKKASNLN